MTTKPNPKIKAFFDNAEYFWKRFQKFILMVVGGFGIIFGAAYVAIEQYNSYKENMIDSPVDHEGDLWEYDLAVNGDTIWYYDGEEQIEYDDDPYAQTKE